MVILIHYWGHWKPVAAGRGSCGSGGRAGHPLIAGSLLILSIFWSEFEHFPSEWLLMHKKCRCSPFFDRTHYRFWRNQTHPFAKINVFIDILEHHLMEDCSSPVPAKEVKGRGAAHIAKWLLHSIACPIWKNYKMQKTNKQIYEWATQINSQHSCSYI